MKKKIIFFLLFSLFFLKATKAQTSWIEIRSDHFIIYYLDKEHQNFAEEIAKKAEEYYNLVAAGLGYVRYSNFWKWENRVKIFIYPNHEEYLKATNKPQWSHGMADYVRKEILSYFWGSGFLDSLLPHEIGHLVFRDFVGFKSEVPLWLDEGVAQWQEKGSRAKRQLLLKEFFHKNLLLSVDDLMSLDIRNVKEQERIYIRSINLKDNKHNFLFLSGNKLVELYYLQAFSLVGFLIEQHTGESFAVFCRQLRDGKTVAEALKFAYPSKMRSIEELEQSWKEYLSNAN